MKTFAIGDIHGAFKAMMQCFERSRFDYDQKMQKVQGAARRILVPVDRGKAVRRTAVNQGSRAV